MGGTPSPLPVSRQQQQQRANQLTKGQSGFTGSARAATTAGAAAAEGASTGTAPSGGGKRNRGRKQTVTAPPARKLLDGDGQEEGESPPASEANGAAARAAGESRNDEFNGASTAAASSASVDLDRASVRARVRTTYVCQHSLPTGLRCDWCEDICTVDYPVLRPAKYVLTPFSCQHLCRYVMIGPIMFALIEDMCFDLGHFFQSRVVSCCFFSA